MTIAEVRARCKSVLERVPRDVLILAVLILASSASFGLGYLAGSAPETRVSIDPSEAFATTSSTGKYVASKNGTKYYLPSCAGAGRIAGTNKVWFASEEDARAAGYALASNCDGP